MSGIRDYFLKNVGLKVFSLLLAMLLWFQIAGQDTIQRTLSLPVEFVNMPAELQISNAYEREVDVIIRARDATNLDSRSMSVVLDLEGVEPGLERFFSLGEENIKNRPSGIDVLGFAPARIRLQLERHIRKVIEVVPLLTGEPAEGYEVSRVQASPVNVSGPQSRVDRVSEARTVPIDIEGLSSTLMAETSVDTDDPSLRLDPASVSVVVTIEEKRREVKVRRIPVRTIPDDAQVALLTKRADIVGTVPISFTEELTAEEFAVEVDVQALTPQEEPYELVPRITVVAPYDGLFRLTSVVPESVRVKTGR